jgi:hypothetical protein
MEEHESNGEAVIDGTAKVIVVMLDWKLFFVSTRELRSWGGGFFFAHLWPPLVWMTPALSGSIEAELVVQAAVHMRSVKIREQKLIRWLKKATWPCS